MHAQASYPLPICLSGGIGTLGIMLLLGIAGMLLLWSFSCLGSGLVTIGIAA